MATSVLDILNIALDYIGEEPLVTEADDRKAQRIATRQYPLARRTLFRSYNWAFARARAMLGPEAAAPLFGFQSKFLLPVDCVRFVGFYDQIEPQANYTSTTIPHRIEGRYLLADGDTAPIFYIRDVTNVTEFDPCFEDVLAWDLAIRVSLGLAGGGEAPKTLVQGRAFALRTAKIASAFEGTPEIFDASTWVDASDGYSPRTRIGPVV